MKSGIYKITNLVNGKFLVGSSINIQRRWKEHVWRLNKGKPARTRREHKFENGIELKYCGKCKKWLELTFFNKNKNTWDKVETMCKICYSSEDVRKQDRAKVRYVEQNAI